MTIRIASESNIAKPKKTFQKMAVVRHKEAIHSGHFMVSNFEAEAQDDEEDIAVPVRITKFIVVNRTSWW